MSVQEKGYLLAGELMPSNLRIRMLYTVMFLSKLSSILVYCNIKDKIQEDEKVTIRMKQLRFVER